MDSGNKFFPYIIPPFNFQYIIPFNFQAVSCPSSCFVGQLGILNEILILVIYCYTSYLVVFLGEGNSTTINLLLVPSSSTAFPANLNMMALPSITSKKVANVALLTKNQRHIMLEFGIEQKQKKLVAKPSKEVAVKIHEE